MYNELKTNIVQIEIDNGSGFCFGVTTAIKKAEEELAKGGKLYCLGDIVHNGMEVERLHEAGLITIDHEQMEELQGQILDEFAARQVGRCIPVLVEGPWEEDGGLMTGRTWADSPEIDSFAVIDGNCRPGEIVPVRITRSEGDVLFGECVIEAAGHRREGFGGCKKSC